MCDFFEDWDAEDFAFWGGYIETQLEGARDVGVPDEPESDGQGELSDEDEGW